jgi:biopolymer transport protein ExbD
MALPQWRLIADTEGMALGNTGRAAINITPLVDIVLVLLIIFMVAVPQLNKQIPVEVPPEAPEGSVALLHPITLEVNGDLSVDVDDTAGGRTRVRRVDLAPVLKSQLARPGTAPTVFVDVADGVRWGDAVGVMDTVRGVAGDQPVTIAVPTDRSATAKPELPDQWPSAPASSPGGKVE